MIPTRCSGHLVLCALFLAAPWLAACSEEPPSPEVVSIEPAAGKGGGGKGGDKVKVDETDPSETVPDTRLDVRVLGSGYDDGSQATFILGSTAATLTTHSTSFVSSTELVADLEAPADAEVGLYDVEVLTARGRKGIGIELFHVQGGDLLPVQVTFRDDAGDGVMSDGDGVYTHEVDKVFAHLRDDPRWDWVFRLFTAYFLKGKERPIREVCFDFGSADPDLPFGGTGCDSANVFTGDPRDATAVAVVDGMLGMAEGQTITMTSGIAFEVDGFAWRLRYGFDCELNRFPFSDPGYASRVTVTRVAGGVDVDGDTVSDEWTIEGGIGGSEAILCKTNLKGKEVTTTVGPFTMPFQLTAVRLP